VQLSPNLYSTGKVHVFLVGCLILLAQLLQLLSHQLRHVSTICVLASYQTNQSAMLLTMLAVVHVLQMLNVPSQVEPTVHLMVQLHVLVVLTA